MGEQSRFSIRRGILRPTPVGHPLIVFQEELDIIRIQWFEFVYPIVMIRIQTSFISLIIVTCFAFRITLSANLGEALEAPDLTWSTSPEAPWVVQSDVSFGTPTAVKATHHPDPEPGLGSSTFLKVVTPGPGHIEFYHGSDDRFAGRAKVEVGVPGVLYELNAEAGSWKRRILYLPNGEATWEFHASSGNTDSSFYLDRVKFFPETDPPILFNKGKIEVQILFEEMGIGRFLEISALPDEGWEFLGWTGDLDTDSQIIQVWYDPELELMPLVQKTFDYSGYEVTSVTSGGNEPWEIVDGKLVPGILASGLQESRASFEFEESGVFTFTMTGEESSRPYFSITLNDQPVEPQLLDVDSNRFQILIPLSGADLEFKLEWLNSSSHRGVYISDLAFSSGVAVSLEADGRGSVSISPPGDVFQLGELVTLQVEPEPGHFFAGWITEHPFPIPINEPFHLRNYLKAKAIFLPKKLSNFRLYGTGILTPDDSSYDEFVLSTENNDVEYGHGGIETEIQAPATLYLDFKYEETSLFDSRVELEVLINGKEVGELWDPLGVWQSWAHDFDHDLHESNIYTLQIGAIGKFPRRWDGFYKNIRIVSGYRLNLEAENGTVFTVPKKKNFTPGEFVTLNADPDAGYEFVQWLGKDFSSEDNQVEFQVQDHTTVTAYFGSFLDDTDKSWLSWGNPGWQEKKSQDSSNALEFNLKNKTLQGPSISGLRSNITGPGILNFEYLLGTDSTNGGLIYSVRIGQKKYVLSRATSEDWLPFSAVIPDGEQPIEFLLEYDGSREKDTEFAIRSFEFQSGYGLDITTIGGSVAITDEKQIYPPGESVSLLAEAGDLPLILWSGDAVSTDPHLEITMNGPKSLQAHFGEVFEIQGESIFASGPRLWENETGSNIIGIRLDPGEAAVISILPQSAGTIVYDIQGGNFQKELVVSLTINGKTTDITGFPLEFKYPHESSYFDDSNQVQFKFENRSETNELNVSFELLDLNSGIEFNSNDSPGGTLTSSHPSGRHPKGTVISLEATPGEGNRLSQWIGLPEVLEKKFELVLEEPAEITPIFTLDSWYPLPFETSDIYGNWYVTEINETSSALSIRADDFFPYHNVFGLDAHVNGPGVLSIESVDFSHQPRYYRPYEPFRKFVDAGLQEIEFNVGFYSRDTDPSAEFVKIRYQEGYFLGVPNWVERSFGPISVSPSNNVMVAPGIEVTLLARPNENFKFVDWGPLVGSSENPVTFVIQDHMEIIPTIVPKDFVAGVKTRLSHSDILVSYSANEGPENSPSIKYKSTGEEGLQIELELQIPQEPGYFKFSWRLNSDQGRASLIFPDPGQGFQDSHAGLENVTGDWEEDGFFITQGVLNHDGKYIIRALIPSGSEFELGGFEFTPGFRLFPSVKGGTFTVSPEQMVYDDSETITLTAIPEDPSTTFLGWVGDRVLNDRISNFTITEDTELTGFFGKAIDFEGPDSDLRFFTSLLPEWRTEIYEWSSELKITVHREENSLLSLPLDGPGLFEWETKGVGYNIWSVFLGDEKVDLKVLPISGTNRISIPEGGHTIRWFNPSRLDRLRWDYWLVDPTYQNGLVLDLRTPVGSINLNPFKPVYEPGDEVEVILSLPGAVEFVDWSGDLVGFPDRFTLSIDKNFHGPALTKDTLKYGGQIWEYDGYSWAYGSRYGWAESSHLTSDTNYTGGTPTITTEIQGPSTVYYFGVTGNASPPSTLIYLNDELQKSILLAHNGRSQIHSGILNIPDGNHILKIVNENGRFILREFVVYPVQPDWEWISFLGGNTDGAGVFPPIVYNKNLDSDGDSIPNYFEFIFQKDPFVRDLEKIIELVPSIESPRSQPFVRLGKLPRNLVNGKSLSIELSTDLENWEVLLEIDTLNLPNLSEPLMLPIPGYIPSMPLFARLRTFP